MVKAALKIGPANHGQRMSLAEFANAEAQEGFLYELSRGIVIVSDIPNLRHLAQISAIRRQVAAYDLAHPGRIHTIAAGSECKIVVRDLDSERHPDLAIYLGPPPDDEDLWSSWIPDILMEIVSPGSEHRDYQEK